MTADNHLPNGTRSGGQPKSANRRESLAGLSLVYQPDPILRVVCAPVGTFDSSLRDLVQKMFVLMQAHSGIGLAALQVAVAQRVLVCELAGQQLCLTNPEIQPAATPSPFVEGCLSLPDVHIQVSRPERIHVSGFDTHGHRIHFSATGMWARVLQHEADHLDGVLICDHGNPLDLPCGPRSPSSPTLLIEE